jgi:signal transduction histidine kinase
MSRYSVTDVRPKDSQGHAGMPAEIQWPLAGGGALEVARLTAAPGRSSTIGPLSDRQWAVLAHDLRSHLNAIQLSTETARLSVRSGGIDFRSLLSRIERNARMALDIIDSQQVQRPPQLADRRVSIRAARLDELARETIDAMQPLAERAGIHVSLSASAAVSVHGDRVCLGRVISNLLANAIRHSPEGSSIDVVVTRHESAAVCRVADRGPGVPIGDRRRIFERHFQGNGVPGAAGLGLFICREVVEEHGGQIWVEDHSPRGARFVFTIPLEQRAPNLLPAEAIRAPMSTRLGSPVAGPC